MSNEGSLCPSAPWHHEGAIVFGVTAGTAKAPKVLFLKQMQAPTDALKAKLGDVAPEQVFRVAAPCRGSGCQHHSAATNDCGLATRIVQQVDPVQDRWATCGIRASCVWWAQEGVAACIRCPQIATRNLFPSEQVRRASTPD
jgi:hypothetical protein